MPDIYTDEHGDEFIWDGDKYVWHNPKEEEE